ncbi:MAG: hypothetical protein LQ339_003031 [Xanthoria mediterranea]|nr:MAG: hypothetical protein LQ339_003031 [Xanthoria mediterranea]
MPTKIPAHRCNAIPYRSIANCARISHRPELAWNSNALLRLKQISCTRVSLSDWNLTDKFISCSQKALDDIDQWLSIAKKRGYTPVDGEHQYVLAHLSFPVLYRTRCCIHDVAYGLFPGY